MSEIIITRKYLRDNPDHVFVFGDNLKRVGKGGAAKLRYEPNTYGFITKKSPNDSDMSFFTVDEYRDVFLKELKNFIWEINLNKSRTYLISKIGSGLANRFGIYENVIRDKLRSTLKFPNVIFLWSEEEVDK